MFTLNKMKEIDKKQNKTSDWYKDSVLTTDQFKQLIEAKLLRARQYTSRIQQEAKLHDRR